MKLVFFSVQELYRLTEVGLKYNINEKCYTWLKFSRRNKYTGWNNTWLEHQWKNEMWNDGIKNIVFGGDGNNMCGISSGKRHFAIANTRQQRILQVVHTWWYISYIPGNVCQQIDLEMYVSKCCRLPSCYTWQSEQEKICWHNPTIKTFPSVRSLFSK